MLVRQVHGLPMAGLAWQERLLKTLVSWVAATSFGKRTPLLLAAVTLKPRRMAMKKIYGVFLAIGLSIPWVVGCAPSKSVKLHGSVRDTYGQPVKDARVSLAVGCCQQGDMPCRKYADTSSTGDWT